MGGSNPFEFHTTRGSLSAWYEAEHGHAKCFEPKNACGPAFSQSFWRRRSLGATQFKELTNTKRPCTLGADLWPMAALTVQESVVSASIGRRCTWLTAAPASPPASTSPPGLSALPPKADFAAIPRNVRF
jgi:hypothetical protein